MVQHRRSAANRPRRAAPDWVAVLDAAYGAVLRVTLRQELAPPELATAVLGVLPAPLGAALRRALHGRGWLSADARLPCDLLAGPLARDLRRYPRKFLQLALFGLPGQGLSYRDRRRQDLYQQFCAEIYSGAVDSDSLRNVARRALHHPDVVGDPVLSSMLASFISQREAALSAGPNPEETHRRAAERSKLQQAFQVTPGEEFPTQERTRASFGRMQQEFERALAQFDEAAAAAVLNQMRALRQRYPAHLPAAELQNCEETHDRFLKRAGLYRRQLEDLARRGAAAARAGDDQRATWVLRRLHAVHMLLPSLLDEERLKFLEHEITQSSRLHEEREAARELLEREREIAARIKNLAGIVHRYHEVVRRLSPADNAYRRAELNYRWAVEQIRGMDTEWLTGLLLQLETLVADLDDPRGVLQDQLDRFIASVRAALNRLCAEIRRERPTAPPPSGPDTGASTADPG